MSLASFASFLQVEGRSIKFGENQYKSDHVKKGSSSQHGGEALRGHGECCDFPFVVFLITNLTIKLITNHMTNTLKGTHRPTGRGEDLSSTCLYQLLGCSSSLENSSNSGPVHTTTFSSRNYLRPH